MSDANIIKQKPGDNCCVACVAAMATGTTVGEFRAFCMSTVSWCGFPRFEPPYDDIHFYTYLLSKGYFCGLGMVAENGGFDVTIDSRCIYLPMQYPAYVVVEAENVTGEHAVYWDGQCILDPAPYVSKNKQLKDYRVLRWVPIFKLD